MLEALQLGTYFATSPTSDDYKIPSSVMNGKKRYCCLKTPEFEKKFIRDISNELNPRFDFSTSFDSVNFSTLTLGRIHLFWINTLARITNLHVYVSVGKKCDEKPYKEYLCTQLHAPLILSRLYTFSIRKIVHTNAVEMFAPQTHLPGRKRKLSDAANSYYYYYVLIIFSRELREFVRVRV